MPDRVAHNFVTLITLLKISCFLLASKTLLAQSFMQGGNMENLRVI
jgi:hypothetical protein